MQLLINTGYAIRAALLTAVNLLATVPVGWAQEPFSVHAEVRLGEKVFQVGSVEEPDGTAVLRVREGNAVRDYTAASLRQLDTEDIWLDSWEGKPLLLVRDRYHLILVDTQTEVVSAAICPGVGVAFGDDAIAGQMDGLRFSENDTYLQGVAVGYGVFCFNISDWGHPRELHRYSAEAADYGQPYFFLDREADDRYTGFIAQSDTTKKSPHISNFYTETTPPRYLFRHVRLETPKGPYADPADYEIGHPEPYLQLYALERAERRTPWVIDLVMGELVVGDELVEAGKLLEVQEPVPTMQKRHYVPFWSDGQLDILDANSGEMFTGLGVFDSRCEVVGNFEAYILYGSALFDGDIFFDAESGRPTFSGHLDPSAGALHIGADTYYHFTDAAGSTLVCLHQEPVHLPERYFRIDPNDQAWSNEQLAGQPLLWAMKSDATYDVMQPDNDFAPVVGLPEFSSYDVVFAASGDEPMTPVGFVLGDADVIDRGDDDVPQLYGIPEADGPVAVYDLEFHQLGTSAYRATEIGRLFDSKVQLRGGMVPPPEMRNWVIQPQGTTVVLNDRFSLVSDPDDSDRLILVDTEKDNEQVLGNDDFDYRYISTPASLKALLQVRHRASGDMFYFDFDGLYFPQGVPMIPENRMVWK